MRQQPRTLSLIQMAPCSIALWLLFVCAPHVALAQGPERLVGTTYAQGLDQHANAVTLLEHDYLSLIDATSGEDLFDLYRNYNRLMGTWAQVDLLQTLLDAAIDDASRSEGAAPSLLRDHAEYLRWELDDAIAGFEENAIVAQHPLHLKLNEESRKLLWDVRSTVTRLLEDICAAPCIVGERDGHMMSSPR